MNDEYENLMIQIIDRMIIDLHKLKKLIQSHKTLNFDVKFILVNIILRRKDLLYCLKRIEGLDI